MNELQSVRTLDIVAAEIRTFTASMLNNVIEIGRRMCEAKEMLPYGQFGEWVKSATGYSSSTANNFMRIYQEYGTAQGSLFGASAECQTFGKLPYSKALALLALPSDERQEFVEKNDVESMSARELKQALKELSEEREANEGASVLIGELESQRDIAKEMLAEQQRECRRLCDRIKELENRPVEVAVQEADPDEINAAVQEAVEQQKKADAVELQKLKEELAVRNARAERLSVELEAVQRSTDSEIDSLKKRLEREKQRPVEPVEMEELRKQLALADPVTAEFKGLYNQAVSLADRLLVLAGSASPESQPKLQAALRALGQKITV